VPAIDKDMEFFSIWDFFVSFLCGKFSFGKTRDFLFGIKEKTMVRASHQLQSTATATTKT
jgi:hypothetical protein